MAHTSPEQRSYGELTVVQHGYDGWAEGNLATNGISCSAPFIFDGAAVPLSDVADARSEECVAANREFVAEPCSLPTAESWTEAGMRPSEKTIRRRFGSFREAIQCAALA